MKKDSYKDIEDINKMVNKIKTIRESVSFCEDYDEPYYDEEGAEGMEEVGEMEPLESEEEDIKATEVDTIREIALKGMLKLCKNPQDPNYQTLKKIFTFCEKAITESQEEEAVKQ